MDIGICVASHISDIDYVVRAEELGYSHAWLADSQMIWSDCYAALALAAVRTQRIRLGTGVAISGTRPAPNNASGIATINALAPGRTFFGIGAGNTAMRIMGLPPQHIRAFDRYLGEVVPLIRGEEAMHGQQPIRHVMPDKGFVNFADTIPVYVSGFGPRSLALAGKYGDGAVIALPANGAVMARIWGMIEAGAPQPINRSTYYVTALSTMVVLDPGEAVDSDRVKAECGAFVMAAVHFAYDQWRNFGRMPSGAMLEIWDDYVALLESYPAERRHQRIHQGHNCWVVPEEARFVTPALIRATCMVGTQDQLIGRLIDLNRAGVDQVMILPSFDPRFDVLERVARDILPNV
jgi:5,10-methylenetetrahydromethanopterin reductase